MTGLAVPLKRDRPHGFVTGSIRLMARGAIKLNEVAGLRIRRILWPPLLIEIAQLELVLGISDCNPRLKMEPMVELDIARIALERTKIGMWPVAAGRGWPEAPDVCDMGAEPARAVAMEIIIAVTT